MKCDKCLKSSEVMYRMMPLCVDCKNSVKENRKKKREKLEVRRLSGN